MTDTVLSGSAEALWRYRAVYNMVAYRPGGQWHSQSSAGPSTVCSTALSVCLSIRQNRCPMDRTRWVVSNPGMSKAWRNTCKTWRMRHGLH